MVVVPLAHVIHRILGGGGGQVMARIQCHGRPLCRGPKCVHNAADRVVVTGPEILCPNVVADAVRTVRRQLVHPVGFRSGASIHQG